MIRVALGVIVGFVTMAVVVTTGFVGGPLVLGVDRVFDAGTYNATTLWQGVALLIGLVGAFAGGVVCRLIARIDRACYIMLAISVAVALPAVFFPPAPPAQPATRPTSQSVMEALGESREHAREPLFTRLTNPLAAAAGIWAGMVVVRRRAPSPQ